MKQEQKTPWFVPALWFITTGCWLVICFSDLWYQVTPTGVAAFRWLVAFISLAAAIVNLIRYRRGKARQDNDPE